MSRREVYVSTDVEADGPIPGPHSMLSFASAAFLDNGELVAMFRGKSTQIPGNVIPGAEDQ